MWMGICRVRLRWRNEWWSQVSAQNRKKHVLPPRLQGIEAEVKYRKNIPLSSPILRLRQSVTITPLPLSALLGWT